MVWRWNSKLIVREHNLSGSLRCEAITHQGSKETQPTVKQQKGEFLGGKFSTTRLYLVDIYKNILFRVVLKSVGNLFNFPWMLGKGVKVRPTYKTFPENSSQDIMKSSTLLLFHVDECLPCHPSPLGRKGCHTYHMQLLKKRRTMWK